MLRGKEYLWMIMEIATSGRGPSTEEEENGFLVWGENGLRAVGETDGVHPVK